jgi:hypothetical protein
MAVLPLAGLAMASGLTFLIMNATRNDSKPEDIRNRGRIERELRKLDPHVLQLLLRAIEGR